MIILDDTIGKLELITGAAVSTDFIVAWIDHTNTGGIPSELIGNIATATTTDIVSAPPASTQRQIKTISIMNRDTAVQTVSVSVDVSGAERRLISALSLASGEALHYEDGEGWYVLTSFGARKTQDTTNAWINGFPVSFFKVGTAPEAAGNFYSFSKDTGFPSSWSVGAAGLNGRNTDGRNSADAGCLPVPNAATGSNFLTDFSAATTVAAFMGIMDIVWVNTGLVVTTTTAQSITTASFPARDLNGSSNGEQYFAALLVTAATTNGAAVTNCTMSYTNSDGTAGRTATMASFPATANVGTLVFFQLQAGDKGVRSIQSITLGTSLVTGSVSAIVGRIIKQQSGLLANVGGADKLPTPQGVRLYSGVCLLPFIMASSTTAVNILGSISVVER